MITAITIENFKGIRERVRLELKPITLVFGDNSAGKSTLLHAIHYAAEVFCSRNLDVHSTRSGGAFVDLGGFKNFIYNRDIRRAVTMRLDFRLRDGEEFNEPWVTDSRAESDVLDDAIQAASEGIREGWVEISVIWSDIIKGPYVNSYSVGLNGNPIATIRATIEEPSQEKPSRRVVLEQLNLDHPLLVVNKFPGDSQLDLRATQSLIHALWASGGFQDKPPTTIDLRPIGDAMPRRDTALEFDQDFGPKIERLLSLIVVGPAMRLDSDLSQFLYLGPLRTVPSGDFWNPSNKPRDGGWADGSAAWITLAYKSRYYIERVNEWLDRKDRFDTHYVLKIKEYLQLDNAKLQELTDSGKCIDLDALRNLSSGLPSRREVVLLKTTHQATDPENYGEEEHTIHKDVELRPSDLGSGISQVLPVVVTVLHPAPRLVAMEQPELHLHPKMQCALGDLFIDAALGKQAEQKVILVETHSEHLILRILRRIRETTEGHPHDDIPITPNDLAVIYVDREDGQSLPHTLRVNDEGEFIDRWPKGFFDERGEELFG